MSKTFSPSSKHNLYNPDLAPIEKNKRKVSPIGYLIIWFGIAVQITVFIGFQQMVNYFTIGQLIIAYTIGGLFLAAACFIPQDIGLRYGISFATSITSAFGYKGGKIVSVIRVIPSLMFFGINGYIGGVAINEISKIVFNFDNITLGLIINFTVLVLVTLKGVKGLEKFISFVAPILFLVGIYMFYLVMSSYNVSFSEILRMGQLDGVTPSVKTWLFIFAVVLGMLSSVAMGMNDFTKDGKTSGTSWYVSNKKFMLALVIGLVPTFVFFSILGNITIVLSGRTDVLIVFSELIQDQSIILAVLIQFFIFIAQGSTNSAANLLPSGYVVSSLAPRFISFKTALIIFAVLAFLIRPWAFNQLDFVISLFSFTAIPALMIIGIDYFVFRRRSLSLDDLYRTDGKYQYTKGYNLIALAAYIISTLVGFFLFGDLGLYAASLLAGILYYFGGKVFLGKYPELSENRKLESDLQSEFVK